VEEETTVERLTLVSEVKWLHFEPAVLLHAEETFWVDDRTLHVRRVDNTQYQVQARPRRPATDRR